MDITKPFTAEEYQEKTEKPNKNNGPNHGKQLGQERKSVKDRETRRKAAFFETEMY